MFLQVVHSGVLTSKITFDQIELPIIEKVTLTNTDCESFKRSKNIEKDVVIYSPFKNQDFSNQNYKIINSGKTLVYFSSLNTTRNCIIINILESDTWGKIKKKQQIYKSIERSHELKHDDHGRSYPWYSYTIGFAFAFISHHFPTYSVILIISFTLMF